MGHPPPPVPTTTARDRASGWLQVIDRSCWPARCGPDRAGGRMVVVAGLKRPEREDDRRSRWSSLGGAVLVRSTSAGASHGLTDHLPTRRGLLDRVRLERAGAHRDPRLHGRAMSALRPG